MTTYEKFSNPTRGVAIQVRGARYSGVNLADLAHTKMLISWKQNVYWASNFAWYSIYNGILAETNLSHKAKGFILLKSIFLHTYCQSRLC